MTLIQGVLGKLMAFYTRKTSLILLLLQGVRGWDSPLVGDEIRGPRSQQKWEGRRGLSRPFLRLPQAACDGSGS